MNFYLSRLGNIKLKSCELYYQANQWSVLWSNNLRPLTSIYGYKYKSDLRNNEHCLSSSENETWKKILFGIGTHNLCNTGAVLYQLS